MSLSHVLNSFSEYYIVRRSRSTVKRICVQQCNNEQSPSVNLVFYEFSADTCFIACCLTRLSIQCTCLHFLIIHYTRYKIRLIGFLPNVFLNRSVVFIFDQSSFSKLFFSEQFCQRVYFLRTVSSMSYLSSNRLFPIRLYFDDQWSFFVAQSSFSNWSCHPMVLLPISCHRIVCTPSNYIYVEGAHSKQNYFRKHTFNP